MSEQLQPTFNEAMTALENSLDELCMEIVWQFGISYKDLANGLAFKKPVNYPVIINAPDAIPLSDTEYSGMPLNTAWPMDYDNTNY